MSLKDMRIYRFDGIVSIVPQLRSLGGQAGPLKPVISNQNLTRGLPFSTYAPSGGGLVGSNLLYTSFAYYMQKWGGWVLDGGFENFLQYTTPDQPKISVQNQDLKS